MAKALEDVYADLVDDVSGVLLTLFEAVGDEEKAERYRHRHRMVLSLQSLESLRWQVRILGEMASGDREAHELFEVLLFLSHRLYAAGQYEEGCVHAERAVEMARGWQAERREVRALHLLVANLLDTGSSDEALQPAIRALSLCETILGSTHHVTATSLDLLARVYTARGRYAEAEPLLVRALEARDRVLGAEHPDHPHTQIARANLERLREQLSGG